MKLKHTLLIACLGTVPLCAQQVDSKTEVRKSETSSGDAGGTATATVTVITNGDGTVQTETRSSKSQSQKPQSTRRVGPSPQEDQKPVAYIGVLTREVAPELRSQFSLPEGFGLMVDEVMPDSPAKAAGLKQHDILVKFEDQNLVNMEQLMTLVRAKKKGDVVNLDVITGGKKTQVPVTLGERMVAANEHRVQYGFGGWPPHGMPMFNGEVFRGDLRNFQNHSREFSEHMERFQKDMREYEKRIQDWAKANDGSPMPKPPALNPPPPHAPPQMQSTNPPESNERQFNFNESHAATNVTRRDDSGEYTLKNEGGKTTFIARPNNGKEQSWPVNTDDERKAVPQEFREKLRMMDGARGGIHIDIRPAPGAPRDSDRRDGGGNPAHSQRPKGRPTSA
ncbi:PDZ domain-containing protein [Prosthecobacter sp.]|uniref:S1C family serine protease n=1 Tax=Prosthecobacter sp. TaxID=1965333 RepID=UPI001DCF4D0B|nr:PDZ domain-containing protein [Prosthecobacter sp.]MCB1277879.1 PDZ domain-containing protein [Prosthecobacter sp.]